MSPRDLLALLPLLLPAGAVLLLLLSMSLRRDPPLALALSVFGFAGGLVALAASPGDRMVTALLVVDGWTRFYWIVVLVAGLAVAPMAHAWVVARDHRVDELHLLLLLATLGSGLLAAATHVASLILGLELLSVSLYALIAYAPGRRRSLEAGAKYLFLAAGSSAFLLFGLAVLYAATGTLSLHELAAGLPEAPAAWVRGGAALFLVGVGFKLALVPFHTWAPDVYQGAPAPVTALIATVAKAGVLAVLTRWTLDGPLLETSTFVTALALMAGTSMVVGNLLALQQTNLKRLLAYSSVAHLGYVLLALLARNPHAVALYVAAYVITSLGAFGVVSLLSRGMEEAEELEDYRGLFWRHPGAALVLTPMLLSLAGIPLTAGFMGKLWVLLAGVGQGWWILVLLLILGSTLGLSYYLRVIAVLFDDAHPDEPVVSSTSLAAWVPVGLAAVLLIVIGVAPGVVLELMP